MDQEKNNIEKILEFLHQAGDLKKTYRFKNVKNMPGDSSADHSWRLALMSFIIAEELNLEIDRYKALKIALVHDLAESITDDIDASLIGVTVSKEEKNEMETEAFGKLKVMLPEKLGDDVYSLWVEYETGSTPEAKFIKALDKIEAQIKLIEEGYKIFDLPEMIATYGDNDIKKYPDLLKISKVVKEKLKSEFKKGKIEWKEKYDIS